MNYKSITRPTLLLDEAKCKRNIDRMTTKVMEHGLDFRPHFKTHQSANIGQWIKDKGIDKCTVSSVKMAEYFAEHGWEDILIAFPVNTREASAINSLAEAINLQVLIYDIESLNQVVGTIGSSLGVKIELDLGSKRSGLRTNQHEEIDQLITLIESTAKLHFTGFYSHPGHTYLCRSADAVKKTYAGIVEELEMFKSVYAHLYGFSITIGDTPGCSIVDDFGPIDCISPGNFVFYDNMQVEIGSCNYADIAVAMACPIVGKSIERNELLIHGGAVHFSKESLTDPEGNVHFGKVISYSEKGWEGVIPGAYLKSISQEHGLIHAPDQLLNESEVGGLLLIYPAHSCLTANLMKSFVTTAGTAMYDAEAFMP